MGSYFKSKFELQAGYTTFIYPAASTNLHNEMRDFVPRISASLFMTDYEFAIRCAQVFLTFHHKTKNLINSSNPARYLHYD